mgnify:CR=1 FL=1
MSSLNVEKESLAEKVNFNNDSFSVTLSDGRIITVPLAWFPRLLNGTESERNNYRFIGRGAGIHWPDLDEDISIEGIIKGKSSGESQESLEEWLHKRDK